MNTPRSRRAVRRIGMLAALALTAAACGSDDAAEPADSPDETVGADEPDATTDGETVDPVSTSEPLVVAASGDLNSFDNSITGVEWNRVLAVNVYEPLVTYALEEADDGSLVGIGLDVAPGLAESWEIDGDSVTFELRRDVTFHPSGNPLTAADVVYSFKRTLELPGSTGAFNSNLAGIFDVDEQIEIVDDHTVRITYTDAEGNPRRTPISLPSMRFPMFGIVDSVTFEENATDDDPWAAEWAAENIAGTGPYYVSDRTPGQETVLTAVPDYWGDTPDFETVIIRVVGGADIAALMLGGEIDIASQGLGARELDRLEEDGFVIYNQAIPDIVRAELITTDAPLDDPLVRQAIAHAIPYDTILDVALSGRGERALSYVNPASPGFAPAWEQYQGDLATAQALLDEAGVDGFELPIFYNNGISYMEDMALLIQGAFSEIGITAVLNGQPTTQFVEDRGALTRGETSGHSGMLLQQGVIWLDDPDPNTDVFVKSDGFGNPTGWGDPTVDELHLQYRFSADEEARAEAYVEIQEIVAEAVPYAPVVVTGVNVAARPGLSGVSFTSDPHTRFWTIRADD